MKNMICEIINVGTEILLGNIVNTHSAFLSENLANLGVFVHFHQSCGDNEDRLISTFNTALERSDIVILTGGLGPTTDDITKEVVAKAIGVNLIKDDKALELIAEFFKKNNKVPTKNNNKQADVFEGGTVFYNNFGTAPGVAICHNDKHIIILPGPPRELVPMYKSDVEPYLRKLTDSSLVSKTLRIIGVGESAIEERISHIVKSTNPTVALYAKDFEVHVRITQISTNSNTELIEKVESEIKNIFGTNVYGEDDETLEAVVVRLLKEQNLKIATAESCTGGMLSSLITSISGSSSVFDCGIVSYSNEIKSSLLEVDRTIIENEGAVSEKTAIAMANNIKKIANADIGVSITGIAGPDGGTIDKPVGTVYIAVATDNDCTHTRQTFGHGKREEREHIRQRSAKYALDMVRRLIIQHKNN